MKFVIKRPEARLAGGHGSDQSEVPSQARHAPSRFHAQDGERYAPDVPDVPPPPDCIYCFPMVVEEADPCLGGSRFTIKGGLGRRSIEGERKSTDVTPTAYFTPRISKEETTVRYYRRLRQTH